MDIETKIIKCPCCGNYYEVDDFRDERYIGQICPICFWQYDVVGQENPTISIGPNQVSLNEAKDNYIKYKISDIRFKSNVPLSNSGELSENNE